VLSIDRIDSASAVATGAGVLSIDRIDSIHLEYWMHACSSPAMPPQRGLDEQGRAELQRLIGTLPFALHACQRDALAALADGRDVVANIGTGWGKTLIYILYAAASRSTCVVVTPLITLLHDQMREINKWGYQLGLSHQLAVRATVADENDDNHQRARVDVATALPTEGMGTANVPTSPVTECTTPLVTELCDCTGCLGRVAHETARRSVGTWTHGGRPLKRFRCLRGTNTLCKKGHVLTRQGNSKQLKCDDCTQPLVPSPVHGSMELTYISWGCATCDFERVMNSIDSTTFICM
jgi:hypothetical protein